MREEARQGAVLRDGLTVVLVGAPNVGKSSLLNRLAGEELAIVTAIPGTTRDHVRATLSLEGVPIHLIDTAGLREPEDEVERIGIERTWAAVALAGAALLISEADAAIGRHEEELARRLPAGMPRRSWRTRSTSGSAAGDAWMRPAAPRLGCPRRRGKESTTYVAGCWKRQAGNPTGRDCFLRGRDAWRRLPRRKGTSRLRPKIRKPLNYLQKS